MIYKPRSHTRDLGFSRMKYRGYNETQLFKETVMTPKKYTAFHAMFDFVMTVITGGFWLIWVGVRYLRTH